MAEGEQDPGLPTQSIWDIPYEDLEFKETIGKGSFGSVYRGVYLGVDVAIKKIEKADDPEYLKYIDREVSMLQSIRHPFIVQFSGICVHSSGLYIITEFVSGGDVRKLLKANPQLSWKKKLRISSDLAKAMLFLHSKKIIHRDLKSKNILLDEHGKIRLCDFGFARMTEAKRNKHMTMCGTEGWVAPEILLGMSYDTSCDVFSYGVVLAELITGKKPGVDLWIRTPDNCFDINPDELRQKALPGCPPKFLEMCIECCQYEPLLRPKFEDIKNMLDAIASAIPDDADRQQQTTPPAQQPPQRTPQQQPPQQPPQGRPQLAPTVSHPVLRPANGGGPNSGIVIGKQPSRSPTISLPPGSNNNSNNNPSAEKMHLTKMVERATTDYYYDVQYIHDLLLSFRCFAAPTSLFELLVQRYTAPPPATSTPNDIEAWNKSQKIIQLRVIIFMKRWIDGYQMDFDEPGMEDLLANFDRIVAHEKLSGSSSGAGGDSNHFSFVSLLNQKRTTAQNPPSSPANAQQFPSAWVPAALDNLEFADVQALELARQISLLQSNLYVAIHPREYFQYCAERGGVRGPFWVGATPQADGEERDYAPNLHAFSRWSRALGRLVASDIIKYEIRNKRITALEKWIEVAHQCLNLKNYDAVFNIMDGIRHPSIERLAETFKGLGNSTNKTLESLRQLVSKEGDYKHYREAIGQSAPPTLPHYESLLEEMWFLECSSPKVLSGGIVNFFHYRQIARKVLNYQQSLPSPYLFKLVPAIQKLLTRSPTDILDDEQLKRKSHMREEPVYF